MGRWRAAGRDVPRPVRACATDESPASGPIPEPAPPAPDALPRRQGPRPKPARPRRPLATLFGLLLLLLCPTARAESVRELVRIQGEGRSEVLGLGLVIGLPGTGDSGKELPAARVIAEVLRNMGNPIPDLEELARNKSAALVMVTCEIPAGGGRIGDQFDCRVSVMHTATDISGGTLLVAPLRGPLPGQGVYAFARGEITVLDPERPTVGLVREGAQLVKDLVVPINGASFNIILRPSFAGYAAASEIAGRINDSLQGRPDAEGPPIATALDDRVIRIDIPEPERRNLTPFVADVLGTPIDLSTLRLPARVVVNRQIPSIIVTGDVRISPVAFMVGDVSINITVPAPEPTPQNPQVVTETWSDLAIRPRESQMARLQDLREALNRLQVPVEDQIEILHQLKNGGQLHAELIIDGD
jgi:flagellar P-ring protein precursor FlgI